MQAIGTFAWLPPILVAVAAGGLGAAELALPSGPLEGEPNHGIPAHRALGHLLPTAGPLPAPGVPTAGEKPASGAWTLSDLEQMALESNPTLVQARMAVTAAQGEYVQAGLYPNPSASYIADEIGNDGSAGLQGGGISQEFLTAGKRGLARAVAGHGVAAARQQLAAQQRKVLNDVRGQFYQVLVAQKTVEVNEELVRLGEAAVGVTEQLHAAQEVSRADVLQAGIEAETARLGLNQARHRHRAAWQRLAALVGHPDLEPVPLAETAVDDVPELAFQDVRARLLAGSPELARARARVEQARCQLALEYARRVPNVEIGSAVKYDDGSRYTVVDVEVAVPLPLFDRNQGNILAAQAAVTAAEQEVRRIELELHNRLAGTFEQYATARQQADTYERAILPAAQQSLDLIMAGYRAGEFGFLALLTAQRTYFAAQLDHLASLGQLWAATVQLEGLLLTGGLDKVE